MPKTITFTIREGDITTFDADVIALKYANNFYGADAVVASRFIETGKLPSMDQLRVKEGKFKIWDGDRVVSAKQILFVATPPPRGFTYDAISEFAVKSLDILKAQPDVRHLASTIHGVGFGLDEIDAVIAQIAGYLTALNSGTFPPNLERITIVERSAPRVKRLRQVMESRFASEYGSTPLADEWGYAIELADREMTRSIAPTLDNEPAAIEREAEKIEAKQHVFVAMPFKPEYEDLYYYAIQSTIRAAGLQAHRIDQAAFSGDIFEQIKYQIETSAAVIAVLNGANANVFLELGYAMGLKIPVILIVDKIDDLPFDVKGQRALVYNGVIRACEEKLATEISEFKAKKFI